MRELRGIYPATVTPYDRDGGFDAKAMTRIIRHQMAAGVHGLYVTGGTGEGVLLTVDERKRVIDTAVEEAAGRIGIIAHVGAFQTADTIASARHASAAGVDAIAALPPAYFFKPDELALERYYRELAAASSVPLLIYNIPQRTGITMTPSLFEKLMSVDNIIGMKDSSGNIFSMQGFLEIGDTPPTIFSGEDTLLLSGLMAGAVGGIGLTYNLMPGIYVELWNAFEAKDLSTAAQHQARANQITRAFACTSDGIAATKHIMAWMGLECGLARTPMRPLTDEEAATLRQRLEAVGFFEET